MTKDNFEIPDYYSTSKPKSEEILVKRKCFRCNKEKKMGKLRDIVVIAVDHQLQDTIKHQTV